MSTREARALIGWMEPDDAYKVLAGNRADVQPTAEDVKRVERAHAAVSVRAAQLLSAQEAEATVSRSMQIPPTLVPYFRRLEADDTASRFLSAGWRPGMIDLRRVRAIQPVVYLDESAARVQSMADDDAEAIANLTLPLSASDLPPASYDQQQKAWVLVSSNTNVRVAGPFTTRVDGAGGAAGLGFAVSSAPSFMQVAQLNGREFLRDGYHRAVSLLRSGIFLVPALVREISSIEQLIPAGTAGLLPQAACVSLAPPYMPDYLDDAVSASVQLPPQQKVIVIQALELKPTV